MVACRVPSLSTVMTSALVLTGIGIGISGGRSHAQTNAPSGEGAKGSVRTIEEVRGLVAELEAQVERQRSQLQMTEASLRRARALLGELEGGQGNRQEDSGQQDGRLNRRESQGQQRLFVSPEEHRRLPDQAAAEKKEWS